MIPMSQQQQVGEASAEGLQGQVAQKASNSFYRGNSEETACAAEALSRQSSLLQSSGVKSKEKVAEAEGQGSQRDKERRKAALERYIKLRNELFPEVPDISGEELLELVKDNAIGNTVVLVDCRSEAERRVSVYKGAVTIANFEANAETFKDKEIVAYCAIGRRSGIFLKKLQATYPEIRVRNHAGSVVDWAHVGGPFVEEKTGNPTDRIHPNGTWAPYLPLTRNLQIVS